MHKRSKNVLKEDGFFLATFVLGKENYKGDEWVYPECVTYSHPFIMKLINDQHLDAIKTKWLHPNGQTWFVIFHPNNRKKARSISKKLFSKNKVSLTNTLLSYARNNALLNNALTKKVYHFFRKE